MYSIPISISPPTQILFWLSGFRLAMWHIIPFFMSNTVHTANVIDFVTMQPGVTNNETDVHKLHPSYSMTNYHPYVYQNTLHVMLQALEMVLGSNPGAVKFWIVSHHYIPSFTTISFRIWTSKQSNLSISRKKKALYSSWPSRRVFRVQVLSSVFTAKETI